MLISGPGCRLARRVGPDEKVHPLHDIAANQNQFRLRMRSLVHPMCGELERTADAIIAGTTNRAVQQAALRWKIEAVPALREALFQPNPFTAAGDTWVLCDQMADYFEKGPGKESLGAAGVQAAASCRRMEEEFSQVVASMTVSGDVSNMRAQVRKWAAEHPIGYSIAGRESTLSRVLELDLPGSFSMGEEVVEITTTMDDLNRKLEIYSAQLPRQAEWETELLKLELLEELQADQAMALAKRAVESAEQAAATVERLAPEAERALKIADGLPKLADSEREAAIQALDAELRRASEIVQAERIAAVRQLHEALTEERKALTQDVGQERKALSQDLDQISLAMDHLLWGLALIVAAAVAVLLLGALAGLFLVRRMFFRNVPIV